MNMRMENPAALAGAHRVLNPVAISKATANLNMPIAGESLAVAIMANRYRLAIPTARTLCELAGIGGLAMTGSPENIANIAQKRRAERIRQIRAKGKPELTFKLASRYLTYHPTDGVLRHKISRGGQKAGSIAGTPSNGYNLIFIGYHQFKAARVIWVLMTGRTIPAGKVVDHKNGDRHDDRWSNLRLATPAENARNRKPKEGRQVCGVYQRGDKWTAHIEHEGVRHNLGIFACETTAMNARLKAAKQYFGDFARTMPEAYANG